MNPLNMKEISEGIRNRVRVRAARVIAEKKLFARNKADVGLPPLAAAQQPDQSGAEESGAKGEVSAKPHA